MGLDYTDGCVNFRDVGAFINLITGTHILPEKRIYRGGSIDYVKELQEVDQVQSIFNLRNGVDPDYFDIDYYHFPMSNKIEKYDTNQKEVRTWLNKIICELENPALQFPILIHCLSGKDRTGIVVAALLLILGIDQEVIIEEYLLSEGEVKKEYILQSIEGMQPIQNYFNRVDIEKVKEVICK